MKRVAEIWRCRRASLFILALLEAARESQIADATLQPVEPGPLRVEGEMDETRMSER